MEIVRRFVPEGTDPFSMFEYERYDCVEKNWQTGEEKLVQAGVEVPKHWSKNARDILVTKYFRRAGVPSHVTPLAEKGMPDWLWRAQYFGKAIPTDTVAGETSIKQVVHRLAGHWTYVGFKNGYFNASDEQLKRTASERSGDITGLSMDYAGDDLASKNAKTFYDEVAYMILNQMGAPNSPQWFNTGLWWAYGIEGKAAGHWFLDATNDTKEFAPGCTWHESKIDDHKDRIRGSLKQTTNAYERVQAHACFILNLNDTLLGESGISNWMDREMRIFKFGSGSGLNVSKLRGKGEKLSGGGVSSGSMSFIKIADHSAGAIKSGGTTRRAAKMVVMNIDHPDVLDFIKCKVNSEVAVASLVSGSERINKACQDIMDAANTDIGGWPYDMLILRQNVSNAIDAASAAGVVDSYIDRAIRLAMEGEKTWPAVTYNTNFDGDGSAYEIVPFQNANHSVRIPKRFYDCCDLDFGWDLKARKTGEVLNSLPATQLEWNIAKATWLCGDPGAQFHDNVNDWNVTPQDGEIDASNPCSEHMRMNDSACNLASNRLGKFLDEKGNFDVPAYRHAVRLWTIILDITNTMAALPSAEIAMGVYNYRDIGLGYGDLGAVVMSYGLPYDSDEGRALSGMITATMQAEAHLTSAILAKELGAYPRFWANKTDHLRCVRNHIAALDGHVEYMKLRVTPPRLDHDALVKAVGLDVATDWWSQVSEALRESCGLAETTGYRNAQITLLAPTGTIGFVMDCDTTSGEPLYGMQVMKKLVGGAGLEYPVPGCVVNGLKRLAYIDHAIQTVTKQIAESGTVPNELPEEHRKVFQTAASNDPSLVISWEGHVRMMAAQQPFLSGAISKTVNMPHDATICDVRKAYRMSHDLGLKAVAIYRDGSKLSQPLSLKRSKKEYTIGIDIAVDSDETVVTQILKDTGVAPKALFSSPPQVQLRHLLPSVRKCGIDVAVKVGSGHLYVKTSRYDDGRVGEIWVTYSADQGIIQALLSHVCKIANVGLQHGVPLRAIIDSMIDSVFEPAGMIHGHPNIKFAKSIVNLAAKIIAFHELGDTSSEVCDVVPQKESAPAETNRSIEIDLPAERCPRCGSSKYVQTGTCKSCAQCGLAGGCG